MPKMDLGNLEPDMGSIQDKRGMLKGAAKKAPPQVAPKPPRPAPNPEDADVFTADKGIQPPSPDEGPTLDRGMTSTLPVKPNTPRQMKARGDIRAAMGMKKGGSVKSSASKRADGIATKGKTKGRIV